MTDSDATDSTGPDSAASDPAASDPTGSDSADADELIAERLLPDEAFELVAHETRFRILVALNEADEPLSFGEVRERVGVDDPGQFNYHLGKLTDRFVRNDDDGYQLAAPGWRLVGAVLSGGYTKALESEPIETGVPCSFCDGEMELRFEDEKIEMECRECEETYTNIPIPAGIFEDVAPEDAAKVVDSWLKRLHASADYGFCPNCDGRLDRTVRLQDDEDAPVDFEADDEAFAHYDCGRCGFGWYSSFPSAVVLHPALVGFHFENGVDVRTTPFWDLDGLEPGATTVESRDPLRVAVPVTIDGATTVFTFDADLELVEQRRN
ncbi:winged helix-turn-helix domain-containing protein [Halorussus litoreus]|uniref:winged helix-turn-helix domain-containing protein n=1 Tax=Halorussus litoreus TaxID=1710536 RepID=UPI000E22321D|nr:helix-turn-helix domain-containing protein [Halorussus litoreus]